MKDITIILLIIAVLVLCAVLFFGGYLEGATRVAESICVSSGYFSGHWDKTNNTVVCESEEVLDIFLNDE